MKKIIISWLFCLATVSVCGQDVCRYFQGDKICDKVSATKFILQSATPDITDIYIILQNPAAGRLKHIYDLDFGLFCVEMEHTSREDLLTLRRELNVREDVIYTSPFFLTKEAGPSSYTNAVIIRLKSKDDYPVLQEYANIYYIKNIGISN
jgi:hypothetical protein